jgi:hypothetical protein
VSGDFWPSVQSAGAGHNSGSMRACM